MCSSYTDSTRESPTYVELRYTKFTINGFPGEKHAIFVPDSLRLSQPVMMQICTALGKEPPSMLMTGIGSVRHPSRIVTKQLRECREFRQLMLDAQSSVGFGSGKGDTPCQSGLIESCCKREVDDAQLLEMDFKIIDDDPSRISIAEIANRVFEKKLSGAVSSIGAAAHRSNTWMFTGPQITNFEIVMAQCIENGEADATKMVAAHMQDQAYMTSETSKSLFQQLYARSNPMSARNVTKAQICHLSGELWNPARNHSNREFIENGFDYWSFDSFSDEAANGHPIMLWPWPQADIFLLFYHEEPTALGAVSYEVDWHWTTKKRFDQDAIPFNPESFAPRAYVFLGGNEPLAKKKVLQSFKSGNPIVVMDNTPNAPKQMSLFFNAIKTVWQPSPLMASKQFLVDGANTRWFNPSPNELLQAMSPSKIMNYVEREFDSSGMVDGERLLLSDAVGLIDIVKRRPQAFKETVCVVDPLKGNFDDTVNAVTVALSSNHTGAKEFSTTVVHRALVLKAWRLHRKLARKSVHFRKWATLLVVGVALSLLLETVFAIYAVFLAFQKADFNEITYELTAFLFNLKLEMAFRLSEVVHFLNGALLLLPLFAGLFTILQAHFQVSQKWATVHVIANQVVSEIYHFLGNVPPYNCGPGPNQRELMRRLQDMIKKLSNAGIQEDDLMDNGGESEDSLSDPKALEEHINYYLYGIKAPSCCAQRCQDLLAMLGVYRLAGLSWAWQPLSDKPDLTTPLSAEMYMTQRIMPLRKYYSEWKDSISRLRNFLNFLFICCLLVGSGLGACSRFLWVPAPLGLATFVATLTNWLAPPEMFEGVNGALTMLNSLDLKWHGSGIRENRSEASKQRLIGTAERISQVVALIFAGANLTPLEDPEDNSDIKNGLNKERGNLVPMSVDTGSRDESILRSISELHTPYTPLD